MSSSLIKFLLNFNLQLNRIIPVFEILFGTFGNIMNIVVFTMGRVLRGSPSSFYFLAASINNLFFLHISLSTRMLASGWNIDISIYSDVLCKLRIFVTYISNCLIQWFIVLISVDRFLSSCSTTHLREWSTVIITRRASLGLVLIVSIIHFHILIWWNIITSTGNDRICIMASVSYELFFSIFYIISTCLLPPLLMIIFGIKTIINVRQIRRKVVPIQQSTRSNQNLPNKDRQMIRMLLTQVPLAVLCILPFTMMNLYGTINPDVLKSPSNSPESSFFFLFSNITRLISYLNSVLGFYIYTFVSRTFRNEIYFLLERGIHRIRFNRCF